MFSSVPVVPVQYKIIDFLYYVVLVLLFICTWFLEDYYTLSYIPLVQVSRKWQRSLRLDCCLDSSSAASSSTATATTLSHPVCHLYIHVIWIGVLLLFLISGLTLFDRTHASHAA